MPPEPLERKFSTARWRSVSSVETLTWPYDYGCPAVANLDGERSGRGERGVRPVEETGRVEGQRLFEHRSGAVADDEAAVANVPGEIEADA